MEHSAWHRVRVRGRLRVRVSACGTESSTCLQESTMSPSRRAASRMPGCKGVALHWDIGALAHRLLWGVGAILRDIGALGGHRGNTAH